MSKKTQTFGILLMSLIAAILLVLPAFAQNVEVYNAANGDGRLRDWGTNGAVFADENGIFVYMPDATGTNQPVAGISISTLRQLPPTTENRLLAISPDLRAAIFQIASGGFEVKVGPDAEGTVRGVSFDTVPPTIVYHYEERGAGGFNIPFPPNVPDFVDSIDDLEAPAETTAEADDAEVVNSEVDDVLELSRGVTLVEPRPTQESITITVPDPNVPVEVTPTAMPPQEMRGGYLIVNTDNLNVRSGPSTDYTVLAVLDGGTELDVIGRTASFEYWYIQYEGLRGWVPTGLVIIRGDLTGTPVVVTQGEIIQPTWINGAEGNPIFPMLPHEGIPVCGLPANTEFRIVGRSAGGNWYQILANCNGEPVIGWVEQELGLTRNPAEVLIPITYR